MEIPVTYIGDDSKEHKGKLVQFVYRPEHIDQVGQFHRARCMGIVRHGRRFIEVPREAIDPGDE